MKVLSERALSYAKQASLTYSTSIQTAEVLEAYTLKPTVAASIRRNPISRSKSTRARNKGAPVFSDQTTLTVVFPRLRWATRWLSPIA